jgi:hypothetical protein
MNYIKFSTNIGQIMTFKYDKGLEKEGKFGLQWNWGVTQNGQDAMVSVTERLNLMLEAIKPYGKTLEILKYEDGQHKLWKILENGVDITPKIDTRSSMPTQQSKTPQIANSEATEAINKRLDQMAVYCKGLEERIAFLEGYNKI